MKAISLTQPWASLVALGHKVIETRGWSTSYRGQIAIAAAKKFPQAERELAVTPPFDIIAAEPAPRGKIIAVANLVECFRFDHRTAWQIEQRSAAGKLPPHEAEFGDFTAGRYGFVLRDVVPIPYPVECKGALGLWEVPAEVEREFRTQLSQ